jgi:hypothetical protein
MLNMRRMVLVLVTAALIAATVALSTPATAVAQDEEFARQSAEAVALEQPQCGWHPAWNEEEEWWEYWCYYRGSGWEYFFWTY